LPFKCNLQRYAADFDKTVLDAIALALSSTEAGAVHIY
jgi:hypothetical protein